MIRHILTYIIPAMLLLAHTEAAMGRDVPQVFKQKGMGTVLFKPVQFSVMSNPWQVSYSYPEGPPRFPGESDYLGTLYVAPDYANGAAYEFRPSPPLTGEYTVMTNEVGYEDRGMVIYEIKTHQPEKNSIAPPETWVKIGLCPRASLREEMGETVCKAPLLHGWVAKAEMATGEIQPYAKMMITEEAKKHPLADLPFAKWTEQQKIETAQGSNYFALVTQPLRDAPGGKSIGTIPEQQEFVLLETRGPWHKVILLSGYCGETYVKDKRTGLTGWIRITDETTGAPLVWWYTSGC